MFGEEYVNERLPRLDEVFRYSEEKWQENLSRLKNSEVKYLLIAEAPPWTNENEPIKYFYAIHENDIHFRRSTLLKAVWYAFESQKLKDINDKEKALNEIGENGFLLVDSLPFAMNFKIINRGGEDYISLVKSCLEYLYGKLNFPGIKWSENVKIALAFKKNAEALIEAIPAGIKLQNGSTLYISKKLIVANNANYPNSKMLKSVYGLS